MPTGYTAELYDGKPITFRGFVLRCARALGACIELRDESLSSEIPEFQVTDYHLNAIKETEAKISQIEVMTLQSCMEAAQADAVAAETSAKESLLRQVATYKRYAAMLSRVNQWRPPSPEHEGLKKFMRDQIEDSIKHDCYFVSNGYPEEPKFATPKSGEAWRADMLGELYRSLLYHTKQHEEEVQRTAERNLWVSRLKASLEGESPCE
ncbi:MAG: hypothetical protein WC654_03760 [Patescibacteria group bacterium]